MRLLLPTKPFLCTSCNHFISKVVHDKVPFVHEDVAKGPRLHIGCLPNLLLHMRRNGHNCTSALNIKFSVPFFVQNLNFCQFCCVFDHFGHFLCTCAETTNYFPCKIWFHIQTPCAQFPIWREILEIGPQFQVFLANFLLRMCKNSHKPTSSQILNPKFEIPMGCFLFKYEFW